MTAQKLLRSSAAAGFMTFLSRILGFIRDMVIARVFGSSMAADAFFVAFKIPNFLRRLFAEGAFSQAFVPVLSEYKAKYRQEEVKDLVDHVAGMLGGILLIVSLGGVLLAPVLIMIFAPGYITGADGRYELAVAMLRITFPYLLLISLTALGGAILNTWHKFAVPAFAPVLLNLSMIGSSIYLAPLLETPVYALAFGVFSGGVLQLVFIIPFLLKLKLLPLPRIKRRDKGVNKVLRLMAPALFGVSVSQINLLLDVVIASFLATGSISWLYYADRLMEFPLGVFGIAVATVILPGLASDHVTQNLPAFHAKLDWSLRLVFLGSLPAALGLFLLAEPMLVTLFHYGKFNRMDVEMAGIALKAYSFGLTAFILVKVLANGFYARQNTKTPVKVGIIAMAVNMVLNIVFVLTMIKTGFNAPHAGLALATVCSAAVNASLLFYLLYKRKFYLPLPGWGGYLFKLMTALGLMGITVIALNHETASWVAWNSWQRTYHIGFIIITAMAVYFAALAAMKVKFWR